MSILKEEKSISIYRSSQYSITDERGMTILSLDNDFLEYPRFFHKHIHHMLEISIIKDGEGTYEIGDNNYQLHKGDVFIISNTEPHRISLLPNQKVKNMVIHFDPSLLVNFLSYNSSASLVDIFYRFFHNFSNKLDETSPMTSNIYHKLLSVEREFSEQMPHYKLFIEVELESIFCCLLRYYIQDYSDTTYEHFSRKELYNIDKVIQHIHFNLNDNLTLHEISSIAHVCPSYFSSLFKRFMGISLFEYISQKRIAEACQLLASTSKKIAEIYVLCGFNNSTSFNKAFLRFIGCSPSNYRKLPNYHHKNA